MNHLQNLVEVTETAIEQWLKDRIGDGKTIADSQAGDVVTIGRAAMGSFKLRSDRTSLTRVGRVK